MIIATELLLLGRLLTAEWPMLTGATVPLLELLLGKALFRLHLVAIPGMDSAVMVIRLRRHLRHLQRQWGHLLEWVVCLLPHLQAWECIQAMEVHRRLHHLLQEITHHL